MRQQMDETEKIGRCDFVIVNDGKLADFAAGAGYSQIAARKGSQCGSEEV